MQNREEMLKGRREQGCRLFPPFPWEGSHMGVSPSWGIIVSLPGGPLGLLLGAALKGRLHWFASVWHCSFKKSLLSSAPGVGEEMLVAGRRHTLPEEIQPLCRLQHKPRCWIGKLAPNILACQDVGPPWAQWGPHGPPWELPWPHGAPMGTHAPHEPR